MKQTLSAQAHDALDLFAAIIRAARIRRGMTAEELSRRVGVSRGAIQRLEAAAPGTAMGTAFEAAAVLGVPLFDVPVEQLGGLLQHRREVNALLPRRAFQAKHADPDNDF